MRCTPVSLTAEWAESAQKPGVSETGTWVTAPNANSGCHSLTNAGPRFAAATWKDTWVSPDL